MKGERRGRSPPGRARFAALASACVPAHRKASQSKLSQGKSRFLAHTKRARLQEQASPQTPRSLGNCQRIGRAGLRCVETRTILASWSLSMALGRSASRVIPSHRERPLLPLQGFSSGGFCRVCGVCLVYSVMWAVEREQRGTIKVRPENELISPDFFHFPYARRYLMTSS